MQCSERDLGYFTSNLQSIKMLEQFLVATIAATTHFNKKMNICREFLFNLGSKDMFTNIGAFFFKIFRKN